MPLGEVLFDFYGKLKMLTRGYGSFDYEPIEYRITDVVKVDILVNKEPVDTLSYLVHRDKARTRALHYCEKLAKEIPHHQFKIPIQGGSVPRSSREPQSLRSGRMSRRNSMAAM